MFSRFFALLAFATCISAAVLAEEAPPAEAEAADVLDADVLDVDFRRTDVSDGAELSLPVAVLRTLDNNFDIIIQGMSRPLAEEVLKQEHAAFDPALSSRVNYQKSVIQAATTLQGAPTPESERWQGAISLGQRVATGAEYSVGLTNERLKTNSQYDLLNPRYDVALRVDITQPLLRNAGVAANTAGIRKAENIIRIAEQQYRQQMIESTAAVMTVYWELVFHVMDLHVATVSLQLAEQLLEDSRARYDAGAAPRTDVLEAEAGVAERKTDLLRIAANIEEMEDRLRKIMNVDPVENLDLWDTPILPQTSPQIDDVVADVMSGLELARNFRPDYLQVLLQLENRNIDVKYRENQLWPELDLRLAGELAGLGKRNARAYDNAGSTDFYTLEAGVVFRMPIGNRSSKASLAAARLEEERTQLEFERLKQNITLEIRQAVRRLRTAKAEIESADILRRAELRKLQAEQRRHQAGRGTSYNVLQYQQEFARAQQRYVRAAIDYNQAVVNLHRAQGTLLEHLNIELEHGGTSE